jgi:hypothetical protein
MAHLRTTIRRAVVAQLVGKTAAGARVVATKKVPWGGKELPGVSVYTLEEETDLEQSLRGELRDGAGRVLARRLQVVIQGARALTDAVDDELDALAEEIEAAVDADPTFGVAEVQDAVLASTSIQIDANAEQPVGAVTLAYAVTYHK